MDVHDDDLESTVHEGAEQETDAFPETVDELDTEGVTEAEDDDLDLDDDKAEL